MVYYMWLWYITRRLTINLVMRIYYITCGYGIYILMPLIKVFCLLSLSLILMWLFSFSSSRENYRRTSGPASTRPQCWLPNDFAWTILLIDKWSVLSWGKNTLSSLVTGCPFLLDTSLLIERKSLRFYVFLAENTGSASLFSCSLIQAVLRTQIRHVSSPLGCAPIPLRSCYSKSGSGGLESSWSLHTTSTLW